MVVILVRNIPFRSYIYIAQFFYVSENLMFQHSLNFIFLALYFILAICGKIWFFTVMDQLTPYAVLLPVGGLKTSLHSHDYVSEQVM